MARTINSPGVQITETDLSLIQQFGGGTNIFVPGYAPQGPTDEVLLVTSISEFEEIYGIPQTPAERYFYHTSKEILNTSANLLVTRLPYGSGSGDGFSDQYGALFYPVASSAAGFTIGQPIVKSLTRLEYDNLVQNNFTWSDITEGAGLSSLTTYVANSSVTTTSEFSAAVLNDIIAVDPSPETYSVIYNSASSVTFTFQVTLSTITYDSVASFDGTTANAGIIILNSSQTTINEAFEGYYITITDNAEFGLGSNFTAVNNFYSLTATNSLYSVPTTRVGFTLSSTNDLVGTGSVSERIERVPTFSFGSDAFKDSVIISVLKVRNSIYEPQTLTYSFAESHIGSLDSRKKTVGVVGGTPRSLFLEDVVNRSSSNIKVMVNPTIAYNTNWTSLTSNNPDKSVTTTTNSKALFPLGTYIPTYQSEAKKEIGATVTKLQRALTLVETPETVLIDVVVDGGLSTIHAMTSSGEFLETTTYTRSELLDVDTATSVYSRWRGIFNEFNSFVSDRRKDCMFISDPLRPIFVSGTDTKVLSRRTSTFTEDVYKPLKAHYETIETNYTAAYANWVRVYDSFLDKGFWCPSSGFAAAVYARTDAATQPWIAPAGFNRGTINNILDIAINPNQKQRDFLYSEVSINPIALFSGDGFVVFGQKTLQNRPSAFDRVNVRRLFLTLERATQRTLKYFVFEPNTDTTRTRLRSTIRPIFELAKNTQGIFDYLIVCDERNNTPDVVDRNELAVDIYIKPTRAAEFILVNFIATRTSQNFSEII